MKRKEIEVFEKTYVQMAGLYSEISILSKKSANDAVNMFKLRLINGMLAFANTLLDESQRPFGDFTEFNEDSIPSNSDVVVMLEQYLKCLDKLHSDNVQPYGSGYYWVMGGKRTELKTWHPKLGY